MAALKRNVALLLSVGAVALAACSGGNSGSSSGGTTTQQGKLTIFYSAKSVSVGDPVSLAAKLENSSDPVTWSVSGPGSLSAASGLETQFVSTVGGDATIKACAGALNAEVTVKVVSTGEDGKGGGTQAKTITVKGKILNEDGQPVWNQAVGILGDYTATLTASAKDGTFTIANVKAPYGLVMTEGYLNRVFIYKGLNNENPVLYVFEQPDQTKVADNKATLNGLSLNGDIWNPLDRTFLGFASPEVPMGRLLKYENWNGQIAGGALPVIPGPYKLNVEWYGPGVTTGTLLAMEYQIDLLTGAPEEWWYSLQKNVTLLSGQSTLKGPVLDLMPVGDDTTQGTISRPENYSVVLKNLSLSLDGGVFFPVYWDDKVLGGSLAQQGNYYYKAPHVQDGTMQVCAFATDNTPAFAGALSATCIDAIASGTTNAALPILEAPEPSAPVNGSQVVTLSTKFQWSPFDGGVHCVRLEPDTANGAVGPSYYIFTDANQTTIPNVLDTGLALNSHTAYEWYVVGYAPYADMDAFTKGIPFSTFLFGENPFFQDPYPGQYPLPPAPKNSAAMGVEWHFSGCLGGC